jgi:hypothetical protein
MSAKVVVKAIKNYGGMNVTSLVSVLKMISTMVLWAGASPKGENYRHRKASEKMGTWLKMLGEWLEDASTCLSLIKAFTLSRSLSHAYIFLIGQFLRI